MDRLFRAARGRAREIIEELPLSSTARNLDTGWSPARKTFGKFADERLISGDN